MPNYKSRSATLTSIATYVATGAEATKTLSFSALDFDSDSEILVVVDGGATASLQLELQINGLTGSVYYHDGSYISGSTETLVQANTTAFWPLASTTLIPAANSNFFGTIKIGLNKAGNLDRPMYSSQFQGDGTQVMGGQHAATISSINSITIKTSTSTWQIGTRITVYKLSR